MSSNQKAIETAWRLGRLRYKLNTRQMWLPVYDKYHGMPGGETLVVEGGRRIGKSSLDMLLAIEECIRTPKAIVGYIAPVREKLKGYIQPILADVLADCPAHLRPEYLVNENALKFPNGAKILFVGSNNKSYITLRGFKLKALFGDEFAFVDNFNYALDRVLRPALFDSNGKTMITSSPSPQLDHPFHILADRQKVKGLYFHGTVVDAGYAAELIAKFRAESLSDEDFRREYLAERVIDPRRAIVPEWQDAYGETEPVRDEFFQFYQYVNALDLGWSDFTVVLWMYWDFKNAQLVVEDEYAVRGPNMTTDFLCDSIKDKEKALLWVPATHSNKMVDTRVADVNNPLILSDMARLHGMSYFYPSKERVEVMVNQLRMLVRKGGLKVHPRCKMLRKTLKSAMWDEKHEGFAESEELGHADAIAALIYGMRSINSQRNPIPNDYKINPMTHHIPTDQVQSGEQNSFQTAFNLKPPKNPLYSLRKKLWNQ
jgi:hypothetical protein